MWKVIISTQLVLALLTAGGVWFAHRQLNSNIAEGEDIPHTTEKQQLDGPKQPLNILVMGSDGRVGAGNDIDGQNADGSERSDTTILLHVSADRKAAYGVSLPRDAIVDRPDCVVDGTTIPGEDAVMFNTAFSEGGSLCTVQTVEALTDVYVDHFLTLDFNGFKDMVEAVDGVEVCLPKEVADDEHNIYFDAGVQVLDGEQALDYVRERSVLSVTGDIGRMKRQQAFIASLVNKVLSAGTLSRPKRVYGFLEAITESIEVDAELDSVGALFDLATEFRGTGLDKITFITVPIAEYPEDPNRLIWTEDAERLWERIRMDQGLGREFSEDGVSASDPVDGSASASPSDGASPGGSASTNPSDPNDEPTAEPSDQPSEAEQQDDAADREAAGLC